MIKRTLSLCILFSVILVSQCKKDNYLDELKGIAGKKGDRIKASELDKKALAEHKKKNFKESEKMWYEAAKADPSWAKIYFNLACTTALQQRNNIAIDYLQIALDLDSKNFMAPAQNDRDLQSLRGLKGYNDLIQKYKNQGLPKSIFGYWEEQVDKDGYPAHNLTLQEDGIMYFNKWRAYDVEGKWEFNPGTNFLILTGTASYTSDEDGSMIRAPFSGEGNYDPQKKTITLTYYYDDRLEGTVVMIQPMK